MLNVGDLCRPSDSWLDCLHTDKVIRERYKNTIIEITKITGNIAYVWTHYSAVYGWNVRGGIKQNWMLSYLTKI